MTEEKQGAAEWLREKARSIRRTEGFGCVQFMASEFGESCEGRRCADCYADLFGRIADRIDAERALPEGVEWPRFEDGEVVKVGDEVEFKGETMRVYLATFDADGWALWCSREGIDGRLSGSFGERVKRPAPKVLDADGVPIEVGDTVYCDDDPEQLIVDSFDGPGCVYITLAKSPNGILYPIEPSRLSHERPDSWERIEEDAKLAPRDYLEKRGMNPEKTKLVASMMSDLVRRAKALAKAGEQG